MGTVRKGADQAGRKVGDKAIRAEKAKKYGAIKGGARTTRSEAIYKVGREWVKRPTRAVTVAGKTAQAKMTTLAARNLNAKKAAAKKK